jgi:hypothetical protein
VRGAAAAALARVGGGEVVDILGQSLRDAEQEVRFVAMSNLGWIGDRESLSLLASAVRQAGYPNRIEALETLTGRWPAEARVLLSELVGDEDKAVRDRAVALLGKREVALWHRVCRTLSLAKEVVQEGALDFVGLGGAVRIARERKLPGESTLDAWNRLGPSANQSGDAALKQANEGVARFFSIVLHGGIGFVCVVVSLLARAAWNVSIAVGWWAFLPLGIGGAAILLLLAPKGPAGFRRGGVVAIWSAIVVAGFQSIGFGVAYWWLSVPIGVGLFLAARAVVSPWLWGRLVEISESEKAS